MGMLTGKSDASAVLVGRARRRRAPAPVLDATAPSPVAIPIGNPVRSRQTGMIFQALLGAAACLSLVAVVQQATNPTQEPSAGSPSAPPPAVFVQTD